MTILILIVRCANLNNVFPLRDHQWAPATLDRHIGSFVWREPERERERENQREGDGPREMVRRWVTQKEGERRLCPLTTNLNIALNIA